jgi:hypothetical protein
MEKENSDYRMYLIVSIIYLTIALLRFSNITLNITSMVPGANGDTVDNLWGLWWVGYAIFHLHTNIFYTNLLYWPVGANLIYQTMAPISSLIAYPLEVFGLPFAYNCLFFFGFVISGLCMFILADYLVKNKYAAFMAGIFFAFSSFHIAEAYAHLDWMNLGLVPLGLYFFLRMLDGDTNLKNSFGLGASLVLVEFMGDIEQGIMLLALFFAIGVFYLSRRRGAINPKVVNAIAISFLIAFLLGAWGFIPIILNIGNHATAGVVNEYNTLKTNVVQSDDVLSFFLPDFYNGPIPLSILTKYYYSVFGPGGNSPIERTGYITYTLLFLLLIALYKSFESTKLWFAVAVIFALFALGPDIHVQSYVTNVPGPFLILHYLPLTNIIMEPGRFGLIMFLALSIIGAYGIVYLLKATDGKTKYGKYAVILLVSALFLFETSGSPPTTGMITNTTTTATIPKFYYELGNLTGNFSVMQIPTLPANDEFNLYTGWDTYYTTASHKPILDGYVSRVNYTESSYLYSIPLVLESESVLGGGYPPYQSPINENYSDVTLIYLYNFKTEYIIMDLQAFNKTNFNQTYAYLSNIFGPPVYTDNSIIAFNTEASIKEHLFKNFVSYPDFQEWEPMEFNYAGGNYLAWSPLNGGGIRVYAPYNQSGNSTGSSYTPMEFTNATINFAAISTTNSSTQLQIDFQKNITSLKIIASLDITPGGGHYSVVVPGLVRGGVGNFLYFIVVNKTTGTYNYGPNDLLIANMTIS